MTPSEHTKIQTPPPRWPVLLVLSLQVLFGVWLVAAPNRDTFSAAENRDLAKWPACTGEAVRTGACMTGIDAWVADHFPGRESFLAAHVTLKSWRGYTPADEVQVVQMTQSQLAHLEHAEEWAENLAPDPSSVQPNEPAPPPATRPGGAALPPPPDRRS